MCSGSAVSDSLARMDSNQTAANQEAANLANIETAQLTRKLVSIGYATFLICAIGTGFAAWVALRSPDTSNAPSAGGGSMSWIWLPAIILGLGSLSTATALVIVAFKQWRYKKLAQQFNDLAAELESEKKSADQRVAEAKAEFDEDRWLLELANQQKGEIEKWVTVKNCVRGDLNKYVPFGESPNVILCIFVTNKSRLDVSLRDQLGGKIKFQNLELGEGKKVINSVTDLPSGETRCLTIEQRLSPSDIQVITDAEYSNRPLFFNFDDLEVTIIGGQRSPDIDEKLLQTSAAFANAFPIDLLERGQRLRALSEIRGGAVQLYEHLRIQTSDPVPKEVIERWAAVSQDTLKQVYKKKAAIRLWSELTHSDPLPESAASQGIWLERFFIELGAVLSSEYGEYIRRNQDA
jgi:hypothetical protein